MPKPCAAIVLASALWTGCATKGPTHLYLAGGAGNAVQQIDLSRDTTSDYEQVPLPGAEVIGLGYEFNTDYVWLRLSPGDRLVAIKRFEEEFWYDYNLPESFRMPEGTSGDLAVRAFNRMVFAAMSDGRVARITRYGEVREIRQLSSERQIGGLAWDQVADELLVLWTDGAEVSRYDLDLQVIDSVSLRATVDPVSLAYDSNDGRIIVPLMGGEELGEFDKQGNIIVRRPWPAGVQAMDAGQMSAVRVF